jgi:hypothetical protein
MLEDDSLASQYAAELLPAHRMLSGIGYDRTHELVPWQSPISLEPRAITLVQAHSRGMRHVAAGHTFRSLCHLLLEYQVPVMPTGYDRHATLTGDVGHTSLGPYLRP